MAAPAIASGDEERDGVVHTTLASLRNSPESYRMLKVSFTVQFAAVGQIQNPFFTRFVSSDFTSFYGWSDDQEIWRREQYDDLFGLMFISKDNDQLEQLFQLERYDRLRIEGVVRNTFQGKPWVEVLTFSKLEEQVNTATLSHMYRGEQLMSQRKWNLAISELSLAPAAGVPAHVRAQVHRNLGICHLRLGEPAAARTQLSNAVSLMDKVDTGTERLLRIADMQPELGLDRHVDQQAIGDTRRPLWEAFEKVSAPAK